jgi:hypothetical protein
MERRLRALPRPRERTHGAPHAGQHHQPGKAGLRTRHGPNSTNGPRTPTIEAHTHHRAGSPASECIACHMPKIEQTIGDVNVRAHTFKFITPSQTDALGVPNPCNTCHSDKTTGWATKILSTWSERSPWRMTQ